MADININPNISLGVQPPNPIGSLGQTIQTAAGMQEFIKARELLPYAIEAGKAQSESAKTAAQEALLKLKKAQELYQPEIAKGKAESQSAESAAASAALKLSGEKAQVGRTIAGALATHPIIVEGKDQVGMMGLLSQAQQDLINAGLTPQEALTAVAPFANAVHTNPKAVKMALENVVRQAAGPASQIQLQTPSLINQAGAPATYTAGTATITPANVQQPEQAPQQPAAQAPQGLPQIGGISLSYPVRKAGDIRPMAPSEEADTTSQQKHRTALTDRQRNLTSAERISDEVIKTAKKLEDEAFFSKGGIAGNLERKFRMWFSSEEYDRLAKDLANQALSNAAVLGASTTAAGINLADAATGTVKVPPEVLIEIARRNKADQTNIDLQARAKTQFSQQFGDNNGATFDQLWRDNSDSRLFEAMSIDKSGMPAKDKKTAFTKLFKDMSAEDKAELQRKKANIEAMSKGNFAGIK